MVLCHFIIQAQKDAKSTTVFIDPRKSLRELLQMHGRNVDQNLLPFLEDLKTCIIFTVMSPTRLMRIDCNKPINSQLLIPSERTVLTLYAAKSLPPSARYV